MGSWAYCGGCSACSDPSLELEAPRHRREAKGPALHMDEAVCDDWCSGEEFETVHQNVTTTQKFSWDMKCDWHYCGGCSQCKADDSHLSLASEKGPFDVLGWFHRDDDDEDESAETKAEQDEDDSADKKAKKVMKAAAKKKVLDEHGSSA